MSEHQCSHHLLGLAGQRLGHVEQLLLVPGPPHVLQAGHGGLAVAAGQLPGPLEALRLDHEGEGGLHVPSVAEPLRHEATQLRELLAGEQHGCRGQAQPQVRRGGFAWGQDLRTTKYKYMI